MPLENDAVLGKRAGLVGAQHVHGTEVLDRVQPLHDHPLARHRDRALGEVRGHDHRQHFGRQPDGDREGEQQRFEPISFAEAVDEKYRGDEHKDEADHQPGEPVDAFLETGLDSLPGDDVGELPEIGAAAGVDDHPGRVAAHHVAAHEADVRQVERVFAVTRPDQGGRILFDRHRLAGERGLIDEKVLGRQQPQVRRDHVAGGDIDDVAGYELVDGNLYEALDLGGQRRRSPPFHARRRLDQRSQLRGSLIGAVLLDERGRDR